MIFEKIQKIFAKRSLLLTHLIGNLVVLTFLTRGKYFSVSNPQDGRAHFFTAQALSFIHGKLDVNPRYLRGYFGECFVYDGKCYGYFGVTPSIFRLPFLPFLGNDGFGLNPIIPIAFAYLIYVIASQKIILLLLDKFSEDGMSKSLEVMLLVTVYFGPVLYLTVNPYMYYEAILWAVSLTTASIYFILKFQNDYQIKNLLISLCLSIFAFHSRIIEGLGLMLFLFIIIFYNYIKKQISRKYVCISISIFILTISTYLFLNYVRFHSWQPSIVKNHLGVMSNEYRLDFYNAVGTFRFTRIPKLFFAYFWPDFRNWTSGYAFEPNNYNINLFGKLIPLYSVEQSEYFSPFTSSFPCTILLAAIGLLNLFKKRNTKHLILIFGNSFSIIILCSFIGATQRYIADLWIPIFLLSILGAKTLKNPSRFITCLLFAFSLIQIWQSIELSLNFWVLWKDIPMDFYLMNKQLRNVLGFL